MTRFYIYALISCSLASSALAQSISPFDPFSGVSPVPGIGVSIATPSPKPSKIPSLAPTKTPTPQIPPNVKIIKKLSTDKSLICVVGQKSTAAVLSRAKVLTVAGGIKLVEKEISLSFLRQRVASNKIILQKVEAWKQKGAATCSKFNRPAPLAQPAIVLPDPTQPSTVASVTPTAFAQESPTAIPSATSTPSRTLAAKTATPTPTKTATPTKTSAVTATIIPTPTNTKTPTATATRTPSPTLTKIASPTPTPTPTQTVTPTLMPTSLCANGIDDDGDGVIDAMDPGCSLSGNLYESTENQARRKTWLLQWGEHAGAHLDNGVGFYWLTSWNDSDIISAKNALNAMPEGQKVLFSWDIHRALFDDPEDQVVDPATRMTFRSPWLDKAEPKIAARFDTFFKRLKDSGVTALDQLVLDSEETLCNWNAWTGDQQHDDAFTRALEADPRTADLRAKMELLGFPKGADISLISQFSKYNYYQMFNEVVGVNSAKTLEQVFFDVARKYYPNVKLSNFGMTEYDPKLFPPDINGHVLPALGHGRKVGTHNNIVLYSYFDQLKYQWLDGTKPFDRTPGNALIYDQNLMRATVLGSTSPFDVWYPNHHQAALLATSKLFMESVFHTILWGTGRILFWNAETGQDQDDIEMSQTVKEADLVLGVDGYTPVVSNMLPWNASSVTTCAQNYKRRVCRVTPIFPEPRDIAEAITKNGTTVTIRTADSDLFFTNASYYIGKVSNAGVWVVQDAAEPPMKETKR